MSIMQTKDYVYFQDDRKASKQWKRNREQIDKARDEVLLFIKNHGVVNSKDLDFDEKIDWWWAQTSFSRMVLEALYYQGDLIIHHKKNTRRHYDLIERHLDKKIINAPYPFKSEVEKYVWHIKRRIGSVGLLHRNASYAFIGVHGLKSKQREAAYDFLLENDELQEISIEGIQKPFYYLTSDQKILNKVCNIKEISERVEFLAPLDNLLWDRKIIEEIFDYSYKWEIYTPLKDRKYGYYVLPILYKDKLIGRIEVKRNRKNNCFDQLGLWWEDEIYNNDDMNEKIKIKVNEFERIML